MLRKCFLECRDEMLVIYQKLSSIWLLFSIMFSLLVILFIIKFYAQMNTFTYVLLTVCSCHVTYAFESESTLYSCLNVKELLARSRREI